MRAQTIQIFLPQGEPMGVRQAEITTRTVRVFDIPRGELSSLPEDVNLKVQGVYFLFSTEEESRQVYVGESDNVKNRLAQHMTGKDFWDRVLVAVSSTDSWTKAHLQLLEHSAIDAAGKSRQYELLNSQSGRLSNVPKPLRADCEEYFETIEVLLSTLGYPVLELPRAPEDQTESRTYYLKRKGSNARAVYGNGALTVLEGSHCQLSAGRSPYEENILKRQQRLIDTGVIGEVGGELVFIAPHTFQTPSGASNVVLGMASNGWVEWKDPEGTQLDERRKLVMEMGVGE
jgi:hypothetical protein